ncbi:MAG: thiolase, partial [Cytophagales bacterium]|nr:thiolase [Rhizobacter sp.]
MTSLKDLRGSVAVVGVGHAGIGEAPGFTPMELLAQAAARAVADAGMTMQDIDGLATCASGATMWAMNATEYLGLRPRFVHSTMLGGSSFIAHVMPAMQALMSGQCDAVLVCYGSNQRSAPVGRKGMGEVRQQIDPQPYEQPYQPVQPVTSYALAAARHMHE